MIDAITAKRKEQQKLLPTVKWGEEPAQNQWRSKYLGSLFEVGGDQMHDVQTRIARALQRFGKMSYIWGSKELHVNLRMRLYKSSVCSILTYGSEAWRMTRQESNCSFKRRERKYAQYNNWQDNQRRVSCGKILRLSEMGKSQEAAVARTHSEDGSRAKAETIYLCNV